MIVYDLQSLDSHFIVYHHHGYFIVFDCRLLMNNGIAAFKNAIIFHAVFPDTDGITVAMKVVTRDNEVAINSLPPGI